jgi:hypothetical protein
MSAMLTAALELAGRGVPVFPCHAGSKEPMTVHGFQDATTDRAAITRWWTRTPNANVAIATGAPGPDVFDVDIKREGTGWAAFNLLRRSGLLAGAHTLCTTRNGGAHLYFAGTDQRCGSIRNLFVDFKAAGGYVMVPPSTVPADDFAPQGTGRYELVWSRDSDAQLDWSACKELLTPAPIRPKRPAVRLVDINQLPGWLCDRLADGDPADRSAAFHGLVSGCAYAGFDLTQTVAIVSSWPPGVEKYGGRLSAEVERSWRKITGRAS